MSVARNASATTSLPNPAALTPAGTGRSKADNVPPLAGRAFALSFLLLDTVSAGPLPPGGTAASNRITRPVSIVDYVEEFRRMLRSCRVYSVHSEQHLLCFCHLLAVVGARKEM